MVADAQERRWRYSGIFEQGDDNRRETSRLYRVCVVVLALSLNVFPLVLPPLRKRLEDIPRLVRHFTQQFARRMGRRVETLPSPVMDALVGYHWPGNVRELQNVVERAVIRSPGPVLQVPLSDVRRDEGRGMRDEAQSSPTHPSPLIPHPSKTLVDAEREHILGALRDTGGSWAGRRGPLPAWE